MGNIIYDIAEKSGTNYIKIQQAWGADGRTEKMHTRVIEGQRGWKSKCYDKDIMALANYAKQVEANDANKFIMKQIEINKKHLEKNEKILDKN